MTQNNPSLQAYPFANDQEESRMLASLGDRPACEIPESAILARTAEKCRALPVSIRRALKAGKGSAILFTSAYACEGAPSIAVRTAYSAARQASGKVLYIHLSRSHTGFFRDIEGKIPIALNDYINNGGGDILPFVTLSGSGLFCTCFQGAGESVKGESLRELMTAARKHFELIILGGDDMLKGGASGVFSDLVDGTILVMEAEKTRAPVAKKLKEMVEHGGGKIIGAVLNRRKHHIPDWIYKTLYGSS
jgi:Mrp family chromosome partitioning ATPase